MKRIVILILLATTAIAAASCNKPAGDETATAGATAAGPAKTIAIDGSSTVYPITEAVAEDFQNSNKNIQVTVGISGTGGGMKKFVRGELDIADASRPIKAEEITQAEAAGISFVELPIAYDGLTVVVNPANTWCTSMTVAELKKLWAPEAKGVVMKWSDIRAGWPEKDIHLYGPGTDSGTFEFFTEAIVGKAKSCRPDYTASEDDNVLVQGIARDQYALGYFGMAYYEENQDKLKDVAIDGGKGPVSPSAVTVTDGTYAPLSRPLFIYVSSKSFDKPEINTFVLFYLANAKALSKEVGYVPLDDKLYDAAKLRWLKRTEGTMFTDKASRMKPLSELMAAK